ncbi:NAD-dependent epimerase/dehydratase family protein [Sporichthya sp.]|uniref:NAD-dependent epimerase/dehydratase family protein n=1 Tax=Sporichthya sp. TaxID=65475 RepID=UPI0018175BEE|nr:NAD-dependent epimerase/dehydratase family protein [Sporichthya sp.]MBA3741401.1 NAD-dependent epimerase/dehydratase family protein [Sporichthya sp.]
MNPSQPPVRSGRTAARSQTRAATPRRTPAQKRWTSARAAGGRGTGKGLVIAITGADTDLGRGLVARLTGHPEVAQLRPIPAGEPLMADLLAGASVLVHLEISFAAEPTVANVPVAAAALDAAGRADVPRVVLCTSAMVYGADEANPMPLDEDAALRAAPERGLVAELMEIEDLARAARPSGAPALTVLRPAMLVGHGTDTVLTRHFESTRLLHLQGVRPAWQFCHVDDLLAALEYAALGKVSGAVTVGCEGWLEQEDVELIAGMRRVTLPSSLAFGAAERLGRFGVGGAPPSELRYVAYPWVVSSDRLRTAGWRSAHDNTSALQAMLADLSARPSGGHRTSLGAAGAAVAMMGTAAILRQARRRRRA